MISGNNAFSAMNTSASALRAQRTRMDTIASNLANTETTRTAKGGPYQRQAVVFESVLNEANGGGSPESNPGAGVRVTNVVTDKRPPIMIHMPGHADADANGNVLMPDIRPAEEMADLMQAARSYEANAAAFRISRSVFQKALDLGHI